MIKHLKNNCVAGDIIISDSGLQCGNCLAVDIKEKSNYSLLTLGELLSSDNETIKRHAVGILKEYQRREERKKERQEIIRKEKEFFRKNKECDLKYGTEKLSDYVG